MSVYQLFLDHLASSSSSSSPITLQSYPEHIPFIDTGLLGFISSISSTLDHTQTNQVQLNEWYGRIGNHAYFIAPIRSPDTDTRKDKPYHIDGIEGLMFISQAQYKNWPPSFSINSIVHQGRGLDASTFLVKTLERQMAIRHSGQLSMFMKKTWNAFRFYRDNGIMKVDIALTYERDIFTTVDATDFNKYKLHQVDLFYRGGKACFPMNWNDAEDNPTMPFQEWTEYDHGDGYRSEKSTYSMCLYQYMLYTYDGPPYTELVHPDDRHVMWIPLHCLLLGNNPEDLTKPKICYKNMYEIYVKHIDDKLLNNSQGNLSQSDCRITGSYIRHVIKQKQQGPRSGVRWSYNIYHTEKTEDGKVKSPNSSYHTNHPTSQEKYTINHKDRSRARRECINLFFHNNYINTCTNVVLIP